MTRIDVVPIYLAWRRGLLDDLAARLARAFGADVRVRRPWFDAERAYDPSRGQYASTSLLASLVTAAEGEPVRRLGVAGVDLFVPVLTHVFGEAQLGGSAAVVSIYRLRNEPYGLPADERLLVERLEKEAIHELGHTFGLIHCRDAACVMRASTYVEEIDLKPSTFCTACLMSMRVAAKGSSLVLGQVRGR